jgi:hypothetical protein
MIETMVRRLYLSQVRPLAALLVLALFLAVMIFAILAAPSGSPLSAVPRATVGASAPLP